MKDTKGLSRREFLKDAGLVVGGAAVGSMALVNACSGGTTSTVTTTAPGATVTKTVTAGAGSTVTVTSPAITVTASGSGQFTDPVDGTTYTTLDAMKAHFNATHPNGDAMIVNFSVNGKEEAFLVKPYWSLARVLREGLGLFGTKEGCNAGECGTCTVIVDGEALFSCLLLACECENKKVTTVEGLSNGGTVSPLQQKFYDQEAVQCGYCTPGFLMAAQALITKNAKPTMADVQYALSGHQCFCGNMHRVLNTVVGGVS